MRAGIIGLGVGAQHIEGYRQCGVEVVAVSDRDESKLDIDVPIRRKDWRGIIEHVDIVSVCSYDHAHFDQVMACLGAGKDVFVEKPLCVTREQLGWIEQAQGDRRVGMNLPLRHHPVFMGVRNADLGVIYRIEGAYNYGRHFKMDGWRGYPRYSVILGGGVHIIDLMMWLSGEITDPVSWGMNVNTPQILGPDVVVSHFRCGNALGTLAVDFSFDGLHEHRLSIYGTNGRRVVANSARSDKTKALKAFLRGEDTPVFDVMRACFDIQDSLR